ncbi:MAG TPA: Rid family hydrolase [Pseudolabrys sp.]|nr:Rid family hydrolase [Pseudolabrys sp.]
MTKCVIMTDRLMQPIAHFSHAVRVGNRIYVGATAGTDAQRRLAGSQTGVLDIRAQTEKMFENVETVLGLLGARIEHVVQLKTYIADPRDIPVYLGLFGARFASVRPSHAVVGSWSFPLPQAAIELDLVAVVDQDADRLTVSGLPTVPGAAPAGVRVGDVHYCTAVPDVDGKGSDKIEAQTRQALLHLSTMLRAAGLKAADVCHVHVTLADVRDYQAFEAAYRGFFAPPWPARTIVIAPLGHAEQRVQIESTAHAGGGAAVGGVLSAMSPGIIAGDTLYLSGQIGVNDQGVIADGVEQQTRAVWSRLREVLAGARMTPEHVLRTSSVLTDWRSYGSFNAGYGANVREPYPPRTTVLGVLIDPRARVQTEAIAHRRAPDAIIVQVPGAGPIR